MTVESRYVDPLGYLLAGAAVGALLVLGLAIDYDTSANVATLEGGHGHLTFRGVIVLTIGGAILGGLVGVFLAAREGRMRRKREAALLAQTRPPGS